jgi:hypothetical protein
MSIYDLAQRMGSDTTDLQASAMRALLVARHDGRDTADIDDTEWIELSEQAVSDALQS